MYKPTWKDKQVISGGEDWILSLHDDENILPDIPNISYHFSYSEGDIEGQQTIAAANAIKSYAQGLE